MRKAIVTGANGFVGAAVCRELISHDYETIAIVRSEYGNLDRLQGLSGLRIVVCNLSNLRSLPELIPDRDIDLFFHFAWEGSSGPLRGDFDQQILNVQHSRDAVLTCSELGCKRFIFAASIMEYEIQATMESTNVPGLNTLYCSAKLAADYMARTIANSMQIDYIRGVISNIYGPGETNPRLINTSLRKMLTGEHCAFSPGSQMYDFIYIEDAAKAFVAIAEQGTSNKTYYVGSLQPRPLKEFLFLLRDCVDPSIEIGLSELPYNGVSLNYQEFDIEAIKNDTGFVPSVPFETGIRRTITWLKETM